MLIPDLKILDIVNFFISYTAADYDADASMGKNQNILYDLFAIDDVGKQMAINKLQFINEAITIFYSRDVESPNQLQATIGYNVERANLPHVHIMLANKNKGRFDAIGLSQGEFPEVDDYTNQIAQYDKVRSFAGSVLLMITGASAAQVLTIQYFLEAMFDMFHEQIGFSGLLNHNLSAQDLQLYDQLAPRDMFSRCIMFNFDYQTKIRVRQWKEMANQFSLNICNQIGTNYQNM